MLKAVSEHTARRPLILSASQRMALASALKRWRKPEEKGSSSKKFPYPVFIILIAIPSTR